MKPRILLLLLFTLVSVACGEQGTTGRTVVLHTRLTTDLPADHTVITDRGWTVTVKKALASSGAFYYFDGEPPFTLAAKGHRWRRLWRTISPLGTAWAHPGHYIMGSARGQMLLPFSEDLLAGATVLPDGNGITGRMWSGTFSFAPPTAGPAVDALGGHVAIAEGAATKDGQTIHFAVTADLPDVTKNAKDAGITGCAFTQAQVEGDGTVTVTVRPKIWFDQVDFSELAPGTAEDPTLADASTTAHLAFALGLVQLSAYQFDFAPGTAR